MRQLFLLLASMLMCATLVAETTGAPSDPVTEAPTSTTPAAEATGSVGGSTAAPAKNPSREINRKRRHHRRKKHRRHHR